MSEQDLHKLLGGYATNTLTEEERKALFEAALHDQDLFNALANEQALKELLDNPVAREKILATLTSSDNHATSRPRTSLLDWFRHPSHLAWAGTLATALLALLTMNYFSNEALFPTLKQVQMENRSIEQPSPSGTPPLPSSTFQGKAETRPDARTTLPEKIKQVVEETMAPSTGPAEELPPSALSETEPAPPNESLTATLDPQGQGMPEASETSAATEVKDEALTPPSVSAPSSAVSPSPKGPNNLEDAPASSPPSDQPSAPSTGSRSTHSPKPSRSMELSAPQKSRKKRQPSDSQQAPRPQQETSLESAFGGKLKSGNARQLFYAGKEEDDRAAGSSQTVGNLRKAYPALLGLRYSVLKLDNEGATREVDPGGPFLPSDRLHLMVETNREGYLQVLQTGEGETWDMLYPVTGPQKSRRHGGRIGPYTPLKLPVDGMLSLDPTKGTTSFMILFSTSPLQALKRAPDKALQKGSSSTLASPQDTPAPDQTIFEQVTIQGGEQATYIVVPSPHLSTEIVTELSLPVRKFPVH